MSWFKDEVMNSGFAIGFGILRGLTGMCCFTGSEFEEVYTLKRLAVDLMDKAPKTPTIEHVGFCEAIKQGDKAALNDALKSTAVRSAGSAFVATTEAVCNKAFIDRFGGLLMGACLNLVGC